MTLTFPPTDLGATVCSFANAEAHEDWVSHLDQDVIHTVHMDVLDPSAHHVIQDLVLVQGTVQAPIAICGAPRVSQPLHPQTSTQSGCVSHNKADNFGFSFDLTFHYLQKILDQ